MEVLEKCLSVKCVGNPINQSNTICALPHIFNSTKQISHSSFSCVYPIRSNVIPWPGAAVLLIKLISFLSNVGRMVRSCILHWKAHAKGWIWAKFHCHPALTKPTNMLNGKKTKGDQKGYFQVGKMFERQICGQSHQSKQYHLCFTPYFQLHKTD